MATSQRLSLCRFFISNKDVFESDFSSGVLSELVTVSIVNKVARIHYMSSKSMSGTTLLRFLSNLKAEIGNATLVRVLPTTAVEQDSGFYLNICDGSPASFPDVVNDRQRTRLVKESLDGVVFNIAKEWLPRPMIDDPPFTTINVQGIDLIFSVSIHDNIASLETCLLDGPDCTHIHIRTNKSPTIAGVIAYLGIDPNKVGLVAAGQHGLQLGLPNHEKASLGAVVVETNGRANAVSVCVANSTHDAYDWISLLSVNSLDYHIPCRVVSWQSDGSYVIQTTLDISVWRYPQAVSSFTAVVMRLLNTTK